MDVAAMKHMTSNFAKLDKFEGVDFIRRQKKMHFLLSSMSVVYVLTNLILEDGGDDATVEQIKKRNKTMEFLVSCIIDKLPPSWKDFKHTLKHLKEELTLVELGSHLRIEESLRVQDSDKPKSNNVAGPQLNIVNSIGKSAFMSTFKLNDSIIWFCYVSLLHIKDEALDKLKVFKTEVKLHQRSLIKRFRTDKGGEYMDTLYYHSIDVIHEMTAPVLHNKMATEDVVQQPKPKLRKSKKNRTLKDFGPEFQLYLIEGTRDEVSDQQSYCFNVEDDPKTFDEAMKSRDVALWEEAINDKMDSIIGNNTWLLVNLPPGCKPLGCKWIFKRKLKVDGTIEKFEARLVIHGFKQKSGIDYFDTYSPVARISTIRLLIAMASIHNLIIYQMDGKTAFLNGELDEETNGTRTAMEKAMECGFLLAKITLKERNRVSKDCTLAIRLNMLMCASILIQRWIIGI
ncbi:zinc finger, CCHC-type containing protein [Tanacetum coccineum]